MGGWGERFQGVVRDFSQNDWRGWSQKIRRAFQLRSQTPLACLNQLRAVWGKPSLGLAWQKLYNAQLHDLGDTGNSELRGIFSPVYDQSVVDRYLHAQFGVHAHTYAEKYQASAYFRGLITQAFQRIDLCPQECQEFMILDIGSGAGNSIFPLLQLFPNSLVIASDLSVEMLALLKGFLTDHVGGGQRCILLQLNAEELDFAQDSFDLIVGAAVLHHLFSPEDTLKGCAKILKRGGYAIFFEPFENGHAILRIIYQSLVHDTQHPSLSPEVKALLQAQIWEFDTCKGRDKSLPIFQQIDDKWLFTRKYWEEVVEKYQFSDCLIYPLHVLEGQFERQTETLLRLGIGKGREALPEWAWAILRQYDQSFSEDLKQDLLIEGGVILKK